MRFECEIYELLRPFHLKGKNIGLFDLIEAVALVTKEPGRIHAVQKEVYMVIAAERRCSWMAIESSICRALEQAWKHNRRADRLRTGQLPHGRRVRLYLCHHDHQKVHGHHEIGRQK